MFKTWRAHIVAAAAPYLRRRGIRPGMPAVGSSPPNALAATAGPSSGPGPGLAEATAPHSLRALV
jgi:hypothetical protein